MRNSDPDCQFFAWDDFGKQDFVDVASVFEMQQQLASNTTSWYVGWSNCDSEAAEVLRDYYTTPTFLPSSKRGMDWIFIGTPGYGAPFHIDNVRLPSWQAQVMMMEVLTFLSIKGKCLPFFKLNPKLRQMTQDVTMSIFTRTEQTFVC